VRGREPEGRDTSIRERHVEVEKNQACFYFKSLYFALCFGEQLCESESFAKSKGGLGY